MSFDIRRWLVLLIVSASLCASIVYANVQTYDLSIADVPLYVRMYLGDPGGSWAYRPVVPWLARLVPDVPPGFLSVERADAPGFQIALKFGVVNFLFLLGTCLALCGLMAGFRLEFWYRLVGVVLFLGTTTVARFGGLPMTDTGFFFFFVLCLLAMQRENIVLLAIAGTVGMFVKEMVILTIPMALVMPLVWQRKARIVMVLVPAVAVYLLSVWMMNPGTLVRITQTLTLDLLRDTLPALLRPNGWVNLFSAFGLMWFLAAYALKHAPIPVLLRRWTGLVPMVLVGILVALGGLMRGTFTAFPVIVPLAVYGIKCILKEQAE